MIFLGFARLARVFKWSDAQILKLTASKFNAWLREANRILAEEQLRAIEASAFPHMEKSAKEKLWKSYLETINPKSEKQKQVERRRELKRLKTRGLLSA